MSTDKATLSTQLRSQAKEIANAGHDGWGNTMTDAADTLDEVVAALENLSYFAARISPPPLRWCDNCVTRVKTDARKALAAVKADSGNETKG